jgi:hypothetical protein
MSAAALSASAAVTVTELEFVGPNGVTLSDPTPFALAVSVTAVFSAWLAVKVQE